MSTKACNSSGLPRGAAVQPGTVTYTCIAGPLHSRLGFAGDAVPARSLWAWSRGWGGCWSVGMGGVTAFAPAGNPCEETETSCSPTAVQRNAGVQTWPGAGENQPAALSWGQRCSVLRPAASAAAVLEAALSSPPRGSEGGRRCFSAAGSALAEGGLAAPRQPDTGRVL